MAGKDNRTTWREQFSAFAEASLSASWIERAEISGSALRIVDIPAINLNDPPIYPRVNARSRVPRSPRSRVSAADSGDSY